MSLKNTRKNSYIVVSKIVSLRSQRFCGIQMYKINLSRDLCTRCGPVCLRTVTHSYMPDDIVGRPLYCTTNKKATLLSTTLHIKIYKVEYKATDTNVVYFFFQFSRTVNTNLYFTLIIHFVITATSDNCTILVSLYIFSCGNP